MATAEQVAPGLVPDPSLDRRGPRKILGTLLRHPAGAVGLFIVVLLLIVAVFAPLLTTHDPVAQVLAARLQPPSAEHWLGTDALGRDIYSRIIGGTRISLLLGIGVVAIGASVGTLLGVVAGYMGGVVDSIIMRTADLFLAFPKLVLAMAVAAALGPNVRNTIIAVAVSWWPEFARLGRSTAIVTTKATYVEAAKVLGVPIRRIIRTHVLPPTVGTVLVKSAMDVGFAIVYVAGLSFIGLGVQPPHPEWGVMVAAGSDYLARGWWISTAPGLAILVAALGFNLLGEALRDVIDPMRVGR